MTTVSTVSLHEEFDAFRKRFHDLREEGKVSTECEVLFSGLLMQLMLTVFMDPTTGKGFRNSGLLVLLRFSIESRLLLRMCPGNHLLLQRCLPR